MAIVDFENVRPIVSKKSYVSQYAVIAGDVVIDDYASVWHNCSIRGDVNYIRIGKYSNIQDNSVLHVADENPCVIGDYVTVGHNAVLHGCHIDDHVLVGMGSILLNGVRVGRGSIIAAGSVIRENTTIPEHSLVVGVPAKVIKSVEDKFESIHAQAIKYKYLWSVRYGYYPDLDGEIYENEEII